MLAAADAIGSVVDVTSGNLGKKQSLQLEPPRKAKKAADAANAAKSKTEVVKDTKDSQSSGDPKNSGGNNQKDAKPGEVTANSGDKGGAKSGGKGPDFIVGSDGAAVVTSQSRMRKGFDDAGFPSSKSKITDEAAITHTAPTVKGPIDVRTMEGGANHSRRAVLSTPNNPRSPRTPGGGTPQGTKQGRRAASHFEQTR